MPPKANHSTEFCSLDYQKTCKKDCRLGFMKGAFFTTDTWINIKQRIVLNTPEIADGYLILKLY